MGDAAAAAPKTRRAARRRRRRNPRGRADASPSFLVRLATRTTAPKNEEERKTAAVDDEVETTEREPPERSPSRRASGGRTPESRQSGSAGGGGGPGQLADFLARFLRQNPQAGDEGGSTEGGALGGAAAAPRNSPPSTDGEASPSSPSAEEDDEPPRSTETAAALRRTYADFRLLDRGLRSELAGEDYASLPKLPMEPPPPPPTTPSSYDLLELERRAAARSASELGRYLSAAVRARGAVRSAALEAFLSADNEDEDEDMGGSFGGDKARKGGPGAPAGRRTYTDYLLPPWKTEGDAPADGGGGKDSDSSERYDVIPQWGSCVRAVSVPRGWHVAWRFAILPEAVDGRGGGKGGATRGGPPTPASTPVGSFSDGMTLASALGLERVEFKLALEGSTVAANEAAAASSEETAPSGEDGDELRVDGGGSVCSSSLGGCDGSVGTGAASFHSVVSIDVGNVVLSRKILLTDHRSDVVCGSYRFQPDDTEPIADPNGEHNDDGDGNGDDDDSRHPGCTARLVFSLLNAAATGGIAHRLRLDTAVVPDDAFRAACRAAADQNAADDKFRRAPMLLAIVEGNGVGGGDGCENEEEGERGTVGLVVVPETPEDEDDCESDEVGHEDGEREEDKEKEDLREENADDDHNTCVSDSRHDGEVELREHAYEDAAADDGNPTSIESSPPSKKVPSGEEAHGSVDAPPPDAGPGPAPAPALARRLREELGSAKSTRDEALSVLADAAVAAADQTAEAASVRREIDALRAEVHLRSESERAARDELLRLRAELAEERGSSRARAEALDAARARVRSLRSELTGARRERRAAAARDEALRRALADVTSENRRLEARLIGETARRGAALRAAERERDAAVAERRALEGRLLVLERKERTGRRRRRGGRGRGGRELRSDAERDAGGDREYILFRASHPDKRLNEQLLKLRRRHGQLSASLERNPQRSNGAGLLRKIEAAVFEIMATVPPSSH